MTLFTVLLTVSLFFARLTPHLARLRRWCFFVLGYKKSWKLIILAENMGVQSFLTWVFYAFLWKKHREGVNRLWKLRFKLVPTPSNAISSEYNASNTKNSVKIFTLDNLVRRWEIRSDMQSNHGYIGIYVGT